MRFDDRLETILQIDPSHAVGREALWRQLIDLLAQSGPELDPVSARRGLAALAVLRSSVPVGTRAQSARAIATRCRFAALSVLLGNDDPPVVVAHFDTLRLQDEEWEHVLPSVGPLARSRLRNRTNLPFAVRRLLDSFGSTDFALPSGQAYLAAVTTGRGAAPSRPANSSIADLVQRIEAYRNRPAANDSLPARNAAQTVGGDSQELLFRSDADGNIRSIAGLPRGVFIGVSLACAARPADTGVDAGVARAFAKRQAIVNGRLLMVDAGPWSGDWLISATPEFDRQSGRFLGYRGTVDHGDASIAASTGADGKSQPRSDGMRQMVHELRSPLNAISGFAQLIDGQYFGPVSNRYRELARSIMNDAAFLTGAFEDIDLAARLDTGLVPRSGSDSDLSAMVTAMIDGEAVDYHGPESGTIVAIGDRELHQLLSRFIALIVPVGQPSAITRITLAVDLSSRISTIEALGDAIQPEIDKEGDSAALGAAFAWRLIERMARSHGGSLQLAAGKALLNLPCATEGGERIGAGV